MDLKTRNEVTVKVCRIAKRYNQFSEDTIYVAYMGEYHTEVWAECLDDLVKSGHLSLHKTDYKANKKWSCSSCQIRFFCWTQR